MGVRQQGRWKGDSKEKTSWELDSCEAEIAVATPYVKDLYNHLKMLRDQAKQQGHIADQKEPEGVKVIPPVMVRELPGKAAFAVRQMGLQVLLLIALSVSMCSSNEAVNGKTGPKLML